MSGDEMGNGPDREETGVAAGKISYLEQEVTRMKTQRDSANKLLAESKQREMDLRTTLNSAKGQIQMMEEQRITPKSSAEMIKDIDDAIEESEKGGEDVG